MASRYIEPADLMKCAEFFDVLEICKNNLVADACMVLKGWDKIYGRIEFVLLRIR